MKKAFLLIIFLFIVSLTSAALSLTQLDAKTAAIITDFSEPPNCYLSIPSGVGYTIDPMPEIIIGPVEDFGDGLDWIPIIIGSPELIPLDPLATITLTGPEVFGGSDEYYALNLWDEVLSNKLDSISIVPEPATVVLFGLGGLALRKRRRG